MKILVFLRMVPDVVEELEITSGRTALEPESVRPILNEPDNVALEQALLLKESRGATVTVLALEAPGSEEALFTALAKGADKAIAIVYPEKSLTTRRMASILARVVESKPELQSADLILTGAGAITDLDAPLSPLLARRLQVPHLGIVSRVSPDYAGRSITAVKEYPDGIRGEFEVQLPAVLGLRAAEKPPRYVLVAKVQEAMNTQSVERIVCPILDEAPEVPSQVLEMRKPRVSVRAEMLTGSHEAVAGKLRDILIARGLIEGA
jgi:electron transfer flavoprotein beta subunit